MKSISAIIVVKNNPPHLFETLASIDNLVSEIIIGNIDIGNDYKKRLLENKKVKIVDLPSDTPFADLVKEDLKNQASGEYILYLDPDEIFPVKTIPYLLSNNGKYDYYLFPRKNLIFAKWIQHSRWWPDYQLRLFKKKSVIWPKLIHPIPKAKGNEYKFEAKEQNAILHYNFENLDQYLEKATRYAKSEALVLTDYSLTKATKNSLSEFISRYFADEGYKDGMHGLALAVLQMFYYFLVYFYYWEKGGYSATAETSNIKTIRSYFFNLLYESNFWLIKKKIKNSFNKLALKIENVFLRIFG